MDFIFDNIKIVIFIGAAVLWIIGKIAENKRKQQEQQQEPWVPEDDGYDYEEPMNQPPPAYRPLVPPPLPRAVAPPVLPSDDRELARQQAMQERLNALRQERAAVAKAARKPAKPKAQPVSSPSPVAARLRDRRELRRAIVMREILDPPVGLR